MFDTPFGVGGNWQVFNERITATVIKQFNDYACGAACGEMLLRDRGIPTIDQTAIAAFASIPMGVERLAAVLNRVGQLPGQWRGQSVTLPGETDLELIRALNQSGAWAAGMWEDNADMGHMILVDGFDSQERLLIRDPYGRSNSRYGSKYKMEVDTFIQYWSFQAVFFVAL